MYTNILVGIDPSADEKALEALQIATHLAEDVTATITAIMVLEDFPSYLANELATEANSQAAAFAMARLRELTGPNSVVRTEIRHGKPAEEILNYAKSNKIDCIVIASHKPGLSDYFLGSTAARVVRHALCTVHVMR